MAPCFSQHQHSVIAPACAATDTKTLTERFIALRAVQAFFAREWAQLVEASFRNLVAEAVQGLPLPALLRFDADRAARLALKERCAELEAQNARMAQVYWLCIDIGGAECKPHCDLQHHA